LGFFFLGLLMIGNISGQQLATNIGVFWSCAFHMDFHLFFCIST